MRTLIIVFVVLFGFKGNAQYTEYKSPETCPFKLGEPVSITSPGDDFNHPVISPDGTKVLVTKKAYTGIYVIDLAKGKHIQTISTDRKVGFRMAWSDDGELRYTQNVRQANGKYKKQYNTYNINTKSKSSNTYFKSKNGNRELMVINNMRERIVQATDGEKTWDIVTESGVYYDLVVSPDNSKVLVHKNDGRMYIYAIDGSGLISCVGHGLCQSWSPDGNYLLYFISEDDGNITIASELYIASVDGKNNWKITDTTDKIELWPYWSSNSKIVVYKDLRSGLIYKSSLVKK